MLVVCTARPELLARRPSWGGGKLNASTIAIEPLSDVETARLLATLLDRSLLPADVQQTLLERAGGNPLYAEQFAQLYVERGSADELPLPETLQGIISARLDGLPAEEKAFLHAGAVVGKVFWTGALDMDERRHGDGRPCARCERASFVGSAARRWPARSSSHSRTRSCVTSRTDSCREPSARPGTAAVAEWLVSLGRD